MDSEKAVETWSEETSAVFIEHGAIFVPWREEIGRAIVDLISVAEDDAFTAVDIGVGAGWLSHAILQRFPRARVIGLDGSRAMLEAASKELSESLDRVELKQFNLVEDAWVDSIPDAVRAFVSSLVLHHLDGNGKRELYRALYQKLEAGGALLIADVIQPNGSRARAYYQRSYEDDVRALSLSRTGTLDDYRQFIELEWNLFEFPDDEFDHPSTIPEHMDWLRQAGFTGVEVFWARSGHAVFGGYK